MPRDKRRNAGLLAAGVLSLCILGTCASLVFGADASADAEKALAQQVLQAAGVKGGLVVHLGCGDGRLTAACSAWVPGRREERSMIGRFVCSGSCLVRSCMVDILARRAAVPCVGRVRELAEQTLLVAPRDRDRIRRGPRRS